MKIDINIKKQQLDAIITSLKHERPDMWFTEIIEKVYFHLFADVMKKLLKKQIDKADDFSGKPFKLSLKYPDAAALYNELDKVISDHDYRINACRTIKMQIHEKLA
ncbi:hypothetical protein [Yeosuana marina]|uniref:hypothetical protein n=1 Tax=Yeosuana marina TaxID=1565536 RepID=UPI0014225B6F|nr:hypothetical protein [Yeosuana marina]